MADLSAVLAACLLAAGGIGGYVLLLARRRRQALDLHERLAVLDRGTPRR